MAISRAVLNAQGQWERQDVDKLELGGEVNAAYLGTQLVYFNVPDGAILTLEISGGGNQLDVSDGTYLFDTLYSFGGSGTGGEFVGVLTSGVLTSVGLVNPFGEGQDWTVGDLVIIRNQTQSIGGQNPQIRVLSVK